MNRRRCLLGECTHESNLRYSGAWLLNQKKVSRYSEKQPYVPVPLQKNEQQLTIVLERVVFFLFFISNLGLKLWRNLYYPLTSTHSRTYGINTACELIPYVYWCLTPCLGMYFQTRAMRGLANRSLIPCPLLRFNLQRSTCFLFS